MAFGDPSSTGDKSKSAEGILTQIKGLLHQYLDLGDSTPLKDQAQGFLGQVEDGLDQLKGGSESPAHESEHSSPSDFHGARKAAADAMRNGTLGSHHGGSKTSPDEQTQDEEDQKKRTKAF